MTARISYRLGREVSLHTVENGLLLASRRPMQAVKVNSCWMPFLSYLRRDESRPFNQEKHRPPGVSEDQAEAFVKELCAGGFLIEETEPESLHMPVISVVIPARNREADLEQCLESLSRVSYPAHLLEIIVVDDASSDQTPAVAKRYPEVRLYLNKIRQGASFCRNFGAFRATGEILCFLDSDCRVTENWLNTISAAFQDQRISAAGGAVASDMDQRQLDRYEQVQSSLYMGERPKDSREENGFFYLPSCNFAVRRSWFFCIKGFDEKMTLGEDVDFCWRLVDAGGVILYRPEARVYHRHRNRVAAFCARRFEYGTSEPMLQSIHRSRSKTMPLYISASIFWIILLTSLLFYPLFAAFALVSALADIMILSRKMAKAGLRVYRRDLIVARFRHYVGFLHAIAAFFSRYYLYIPPVLIVFGQIVPALAFLGAHLFAAFISYLIKRPGLHFFSFAFFFTLEQFSYQTGVWYGCLKYRFYKPVLPRVRICF